MESQAEYLAEKALLGELDIRTRNFGKYSTKAERADSKKHDFDHTRRLVNNWQKNEMNHRYGKA